MCDDISSRDLKHIQKYLADFQALNHAIALEDIIRLGRQIASRPEHMIGAPGGRKTFEEIVTIGSQHETAGSDGVSPETCRGGGMGAS